MAQFLTDFSEYEAGAIPNDWTDAWVPGNQRFEVAQADDAIGGHVVEHAIFEHDRRVWAWSKVPGSSEAEILTRLRSDSQSSRFGVIARGAYGADRDSCTGWTSELFHGELRDVTEFEAEVQERRTILNTISYNPAEEANRGIKRPHGIGQTRGLTYHPWAPGEWHWLRLQVREVDGHVAVRARAWADGEDEPSRWDHDHQRTEPASLGANGFVGITGQRTDGVRQYDVFSVGTDGDPAPKP